MIMVTVVIVINIIITKKQRKKDPPPSANESAVRDAKVNGVVVTELEIAAADVPMAFVAVTANVYEVPGCKPSKVKVPPVACVRL